MEKHILEQTLEHTITMIIERLQRKMFDLDKIENNLILLYKKSNDIMLSFYNKIELLFDIKINNKSFETLEEIIQEIIKKIKIDNQEK